MSDSLRIQPATGTHTIFQVDSGEEAHPHGRGGSIGHPHLTEAHHIAASVMTVANDFRSGCHSLLHLFSGQCRFVQIVSRTFPHLTVDNVQSFGKIEVDTSIHQHEFESMLTAEEIDTGTATEKIIDYLPGDLLGRKADSFVGNTMIRGKDYVVRITESRR